MKKTADQITSVLTLLVFTVFALCVLLVLLTGAGIYGDLVRSGEQSYAHRTAVQYLTTRVRQAESVEVGVFGDGHALILEETTGEGTCITRVYCHGGFLRELYSPENARLSPEDGAELLEAEQLELSLEGTLLTLTVDDRCLQLHLPEGTEVAP